MLTLLLKFSRKIPKLPGDIECQLRTSKSGVSADQNCMFVDRAGEGVSEFYTFLRMS